MTVGRETATAIVREAKRIIDERGEAALRVTEVAERCGVAPSVLYHHFKDRDDIIAAVREAEFAARIASDTEMIAGMSMSAANLDKILAILIDDMSNPRNNQRVQYRHERMQALVAARYNPALQERLTVAQNELSMAIQAAIRDAKNSGLLDKDLDDKAMAFLFEVIPLGTALAMVYGDNLPDTRAWNDLLTRVILALMPPS